MQKQKYLKLFSVLAWMLTDPQGKLKVSLRSSNTNYDSNLILD